MSLKILFVIDGLGVGGAERSLAELIPSLARADIDSTVAFFYRRKESLEALFRTQGTRLVFLQQKGLAQRVAALRRLIRAERPDVIHTTLFESNVIGRLASIGQHAVVVSSLVNTPYDPIRLKNRDVNAAKLWAARLIESWTARHLTTHLHAISDAVKQAAVEQLRLSPERITVIERGRKGAFGMQSAARREIARAKLGLSNSDEVIVTVGRQEYLKGQRYLVEAMDEVLRRRPRARLLLAGRSGRQTAILQEILQRTGLGGRVQLLGHREDVPDLLASADLFVFPSLYEGLGGALLEAMAAGLPIVASRVPAIAGAVEEGQNALLVERASVAPLAEAITELLTNRPRSAAFGRRSREIFEERFTLERSTDRMIEFYRRLTVLHHRKTVAGVTSAVPLR